MGVDDTDSMTPGEFAISQIKNEFHDPEVQLWVAEQVKGYKDNVLSDPIMVKHLSLVDPMPFALTNFLAGFMCAMKASGLSASLNEKYHGEQEDDEGGE